jgi:methyl-accepting chemotaxis protein
MSEPQSRRSTRRLSSVRYTRPFLFRYAGLWVLLSVCLIGFAGVTSYLLFTADWEALVARSPELAAQFAVSRTRFLTILGVETLLLLGAVVALAVSTTHRIAGPLVGLQIACRDVANGQLDRRIAFRQHNDELDELADTFNEMMTKVEARVHATEGSAKS